MALSTKITVAPPMALFAVGVVVLALARRHFAAAAGWTLGLALTGPLASAVGERHWLLVVAGAMAVAEIAPFVLRSLWTLERRPVLEEVVA